MKRQFGMEAIPTTKPQMRTILNPDTLLEEEHLAYDAEIQYKRKEPSVRLIICNRFDTVNVGEPVMITYHAGKRAYQHDHNVVVSNESNCTGGFYYTDGSEA